jgi:hypothetical protein
MMTTLDVVDMATWMWLLASILILSSIIIWGIFGSLSLTVETQGITFDNTQIETIENSIKNKLQEHTESVSDLYDLYNKKLELYKKHFITRVDLRKSTDDYLAAKETLNEHYKNLKIPMIGSPTQSVSNPHSIAIIFVEHKEGKKILPGMPALLLPTTSTVFDHGYLTGNVISISTIPVTKQFLYSYLQNNSLVDTYFSTGAPFMVKVKLDQPMTPGTAVTVKIKYKTCPPFGLISKIN